MKDFEVIIVADGSEKPCKDICDKYSGTIDLKYFAKKNSGPGQSRNYGAERSKGEYLIVLDSDVVLPEGYLKAVDDEMLSEPADAFGGPDCAHDSFTETQKAISYSMTSFFTTGGIRGGKKKLDKFYPRSFNMGIRRDTYARLGGFSRMRFGEDIDFSIRIFKAGCSCRLFPEAWVWHKRRTDFRKFFRQVYNSGIARINLHKRHPGSLKPVHLLPMVFTLGTAALAVTFLLTLYLRPALAWMPLLPLLAYSLVIFADSALHYRSARIGVLSIAAAYIQLTGYGSGFLAAWWKRCVMGKDEFAASEKTFYK